MKGRALSALKWGVAVAFIGFAIFGIRSQWGELQDRLINLDIRFGILGLASVLVLTIYLVLIEAWRTTLHAWGTSFPRLTAARIWFASSLGKFIPGYIWSLSAMGMLTKNSGGSATGAVGASIFVHILNLASGIAVLALCGSQLISNLPLAILIFAGIVSAALLLPRALPRLISTASRVSKREIATPDISSRAVWTVLLQTGLAWVGYGIAFKLFGTALFGEEIATKSTILFIAVYTAAYIIGILSSAVAANGLGTREYGLIQGLTLLNLASPADAFIIAFGCRLWLTIIEVGAGIISLILSHSKFRINRV